MRESLSKRVRRTIEALVFFTYLAVVIPICLAFHLVYVAGFVLLTPFILAGKLAGVLLMFLASVQVWVEGVFDA